MLLIPRTASHRVRKIDFGGETGLRRGGFAQVGGIEWGQLQGCSLTMLSRRFLRLGCRWLRRCFLRFLRLCLGLLRLFSDFLIRLGVVCFWGDGCCFRSLCLYGGNGLSHDVMNHGACRSLHGCNGIYWCKGIYCGGCIFRNGRSIHCSSGGLLGSGCVLGFQHPVAPTNQQHNGNGCGDALPSHRHHSGWLPIGGKSFLYLIPRHLDVRLPIVCHLLLHLLFPFFFHRGCSFLSLYASIISASRRLALWS